MDITDLYDSAYVYFRASSIHYDGSESPLSNLDSAFSNFIVPGDNLIYNGDFSLSKSHWELRVENNAIASDTIKNGEYTLNILNGGLKRSDITLSQQNIPLIKGKKYVFEFDAYADTNAIIYVDFEKSSGFYDDYSKLGAFFLTKNKQHYTSYFTMDQLTDLKTRFVFQSGRILGTVNFDNISLKEVLDPISATLVDRIDVSCFGQADGSINTMASGGSGVIRYTLFPDSVSNTSGVFSHLNIGIYTIRIDDESVLDPVFISDITINEPDSLGISHPEVKHISSDSTNEGSISVSAFGGNGSYTYTLFPDTIINQTGEFNNLDSGKYEIVVYDTSGCGPVITEPIYLADQTSVGQVSIPNIASIYPNPASDHIYIKYDNNYSGDLSISIFSQIGKKLKNFQVNTRHHHGNEIRIRTDDLRKGIYLIRIELSRTGSADNFVFTEKLIID